MLADGTKFRGISIGAPGLTTGEVVFNTSISDELDDLVTRHSPVGADTRSDIS